MPLEYYELKRVTIPDPRPGEMVFATAALITCGLCGTCIGGMGGPGDGPVCIPCGDLVRHGQARTAINWKQGERNVTDDQ